MRRLVESVLENSSTRDELHSLRSQIERGTQGLWVLHWSLRSILAGTFLFFALTKLFGSPTVLGFFAEVAWGQWLGYFSGTAELVGAGLLLTPKSWSAGWAVLLADTVLTILLRTLVAHTDAFLWVQFLLALALLAVLPRPSAVWAWLRRVTSFAAGRS